MSLTECAVLPQGREVSFEDVLNFYGANRDRPNIFGYARQILGGPSPSILTRHDGCSMVKAGSHNP